MALTGLLAGCGGGPPLEPAIVETCPTEGVAVQALGSGGPAGLPGRAVSTYLVRVDGAPRLLVDAGAGSFSRFHTAGARMERIDGVLITRLSVGHLADLPPLLDAARRAKRSRPLVVVGPGGAPGQVSTAVWLTQAIGAQGAFPELAGLLGSGDPFRLAINEVGIDAGAARLVYAEGGLEVHGVPVPHGHGPALGYLVKVGERRVAFTGDQRADDPRFLTMIRGADLLVAHLAVPEDASAGDRLDHAPPSIIGALARAAKVKRVVLGHLTPASLPSRSASIDRIRDRYAGPVEVLTDLDCVAVAGDD